MIEIKMAGNGEFDFGLVGSNPTETTIFAESLDWLPNTGDVIDHPDAFLNPDDDRKFIVKDRIFSLARRNGRIDIVSVMIYVEFWDI